MAMSDFPQFSADVSAVLGAVAARPQGTLLVFDFDGTLADIHPDPEAVVALPGVIEALTTLAELGSQVAVVTGRPATFPAEAGGMAAVPGIVVYGRHGVESWEEGALHSPEPPPAVESARTALGEIVAAGPAGTHLEDKGYSVAVHTRRCADPAGALAELEPRVEQLAARLGLEIMPGRYVRELRPPGNDKGDAVMILAERFSPEVVVFAGDDLGDVPAFRAVRSLRGDGGVVSVDRGLAIAVAAPEVPEVGAEADVVVDRPAELRDLLQTLARLASGG